MKIYIDFEFDRTHDRLISFGLVQEDGFNVHLTFPHDDIQDPWVLENVIPKLGACNPYHNSDMEISDLGDVLRNIIRPFEAVEIIADSPVDISIFTHHLNLGKDGSYVPLEKPKIVFVVENVESYPSSNPDLVKHNAWADATALGLKLEENERDQSQRDVDLMDSIVALYQQGRETEATGLIKKYRETLGRKFF